MHWRMSRMAYRTVKAGMILLMSAGCGTATAYDLNGFTLSGDIRTGWVQYD